LFDLDTIKDKKEIFTFVEILKTRLRTIDRYGFFNGSQIGVILPHTYYEDCIKVARDISKRIINRKLQPPIYKAYSYPFKRGELEQDKVGSVKPIASTIQKDESLHIFMKTIPSWKRFLDFSGAVFALLLFAPLFIIIPLIIKVVSPGPIFFKQVRVGQGGKEFTFIKFRTMHLNTNTAVHEDHLSELIKSDKPMIKLDRQSDSRIIFFGKVLRKSCVDEIPQLFNVLRGDMSLVGPRPCLPYEANEYLKWHKYRFDIKPGMTGLWQVSGKNRLSFKDMIRLDVEYSKKINMWLDIKILIKTFPSIFRIVIDKIKIDKFFDQVEKQTISNDRFKEFLRRYYSDVYSVDRLEFIDDKLKGFHVDLADLMILLSKLHKLNPTYNVAKRYFGICKLIDAEKKAQLGKKN
jgi:lipopolysaccharide/colanic/teichoic acid biosynthesis glycosyltransferase